MVRGACKYLTIPNTQRVRYLCTNNVNVKCVRNILILNLHTGVDRDKPRILIWNMVDYPVLLLLRTPS